MISINTLCHELATRANFFSMTAWDHKRMRQSSARRDMQPRGKR